MYNIVAYSIKKVKKTICGSEMGTQGNRNSSAKNAILRTHDTEGMSQVTVIGNIGLLELFRMYVEVSELDRVKALQAKLVKTNLPRSC